MRWNVILQSMVIHKMIHKRTKCKRNPIPQSISSSPHPTLAAAATKLNLQRVDQRAPTIFENGIEIGRRKVQQLARKRQHRAQAIRHVVRRQLVEQAEDILRIAAQLAISDGPEIQRVEISDAGVAAEEDGVCGVQVEHLDDESGDGVGFGTAHPYR